MPAQRRLVDDLLALFGGRTQPVMTHLVETGKVTLEEVQEAEKAGAPDGRQAGQDAVIDHLWQSTLFAVVIALVMPLFARQSAGLRFGLWFAASVKFLFPFSLLVWLGGFLPALPERARCWRPSRW